MGEEHDNRHDTYSKAYWPRKVDVTACRGVDLCPIKDDGLSPVNKISTFHAHGVD